MRAKFINEKFEKESDPIKDMGIGEVAIRKLFKKELRKFIKEHIKHKNYTFERGLSDAYRVIEKNNFDIEKSLIDLVNEHQNWIYSYDYLDSTSHIKDIKAAFSAILTFIQGFKEYYLKESLNEKFEKESDPIRDMGIGTPIEGNMINKIIELNKKHNGLGYKYRNTKNTFFIYWQVNKDIKVRISYDKNISEKYNRFEVWIFLDGKATIIFGRSYLEETFSYLEECLKRYNLISESFKEESDPIRDMGIGTEEMIKREFERNKQFPYTRERALIWFLRGNNYEYVEYLIKLGVDVAAEDNYALSYASFHGNYKMVKMLLEAGAPVDLDSCYFATDSKVSDNSKVINLLKKYAKKQKKDLKKLRLVEKFQEESDPIKDMKIGILSIKKFNNQLEFLDHIILILPHILGLKSMKDVKNIIRSMEWESGTIPHKLFAEICEWVKENAPFIVDNTTINTVSQINIPGGLKSLIYDNKDILLWPRYIKSKLIEMDILSLKEDDDKLFLDSNKFNVMHLNEKFEEESDPIKDMNIGLVKELNRLINIIEEETNIWWDNIELQKDTLIIEAENISMIGIEHHLVNEYAFKNVGVYDDFILEYYINIVGEKNQIIRTVIIRNPGIEDFESWHKKILSNNFLDMKDNEIVYLIDKDYISLENSDELTTAFKEALEIAETEWEKIQKSPGD